MSQSITIETTNAIQLTLLKAMAQRLGLPAKEIQSQDKPTEAEQYAAFKRFAGSWKGEETAEELEAIIYSARNDQPRNIHL
ncbi:hypothetical protein [Dyadobacter sp. CY343]|uniref:hypothetical protein n=1 Tax=Dyadobacter sp. CY343 TaxID=2907299 RepID=UPI001F249B7E|nr:hypothetical protein [Dyadobacter sp. CY343]MCE7059988.1 hypothetical protein [Dyadobacter sp. CY343]